MEMVRPTIITLKLTHHNYNIQSTIIVGSSMTQYLLVCART